MRTKSCQSDGLILFINPYQEKIILYMALHAALIFSLKHVWIVSRFDLTLFTQLRKNIHERNEFLFVILVLLEIFLELSGLFEFPHTTKRLHIS